MSSCSHYRDLGDFGIFLFLASLSKVSADAFYFIVILAASYHNFATNFVVHIYIFERFYLSLPCESLRLFIDFEY